MAHLEVRPQNRIAAIEQVRRQIARGKSADSGNERPSGHGLPDFDLKFEFHAGPFDDWTRAATQIQWAVDAEGDTGDAAERRPLERVAGGRVDDGASSGQHRPRIVGGEHDSSRLDGHIGSGPDLDRIQQLALQLPSHVRACFTGQLCHSQVIDYYGGHAVDLFVSCSIAEGLPVTIMEAMSFGVPILATGVGGVPELVDDTNGCLLDPAASPDTIAAALTRLLRQGPETRGMLSDASVARWRDLVDANTQFPLFAADLIALLRESTEKRRLEVA